MGWPLVYMGDGIYEVYVRNHVMQKRTLQSQINYMRPQRKFVSAKAQRTLYDKCWNKKTLK